MTEMTAFEMLRDPLIRQMLRADKVSLTYFAALLDATARRNARSVEYRAVQMPASTQVETTLALAE